MKPGARDPAELEALVRRVQQEQKRLASLLPEIDPGDLNAILMAILRPWGTGRRFFIRQVRPGVNVF